MAHAPVLQQLCRPAGSGGRRQRRDCLARATCQTKSSEHPAPHATPATYPPALLQRLHCRSLADLGNQNTRPLCAPTWVRQHLLHLMGERPPAGRRGREEQPVRSKLALLALRCPEQWHPVLASVQELLRRAECMQQRSFPLTTQVSPRLPRPLPPPVLPRRPHATHAGPPECRLHRGPAAPSGTACILQSPPLRSQCARAPHRPAQRCKGHCPQCCWRFFL